jgi:hypothetical protein
MSTQIESKSNQLSNRHTKNTLQCPSLNGDFRVMYNLAADEFYNTPFCEDTLNTLDELISQGENAPKRSRSDDEDDDGAHNASKRFRSNNESNNLISLEDIQRIHSNFDVFSNPVEPFGGDEEIESTGGLFGYDGTFCPKVRFSFQRR